jgi:F0F1-type ATP synthase assembly protein I
MKDIVSKLYRNNLIKVIFLLLLMILTKKLSKSINNDLIVVCLDYLGTISMVLILGLCIRSIIKKPEKQTSEIH